MSDATKGVLTTRKLQAMLEVKLAPEIANRKALAQGLTDAGEPISVEGVHAWFKHQDSNYAFDRKSLSRRKPSYEIPPRRRDAILRLFDLDPEDLASTDDEFRRFCFNEAKRRRSTAPARINLVCICMAEEEKLARADAHQLNALGLAMRVISSETPHSDWTVMRYLTSADGVVLYVTPDTAHSPLFREAMTFSRQHDKPTHEVRRGEADAGFIEALAHRFSEPGGTSTTPRVEEPVAAWSQPELYTARPSIAVLPFANFTGNPERDRLADALAEDINLHLSRLPEFFVVSNSSTRHYRNALPDSRQVRDELGVRYVLEGSIRATDDDTLRVTAQLVDAVSRRGMWVDRFDRSATEIDGMEDALAMAICAQLEPRVRLTDIQEHAGLARAPAWRLWQEGWHQMFVDAPEPVPQRSLDLFESALQMDPEYPLAHAGLAIALSTGVLWGGLPQSCVEQARDHAQKAYKQLPQYAAVMYAMGMIAFVTDDSLENTAGYLKAAVEQEPSNPMYQAILGYLQAHCGEATQGVKRCLHAMRLSPRDSREPFLCYMLGSAYLADRRYDEAVEVMNLCARFSEVDFVWLMLAYAHERCGRERELQMCLKHIASAGRVPLMRWSLKHRMWTGHSLEEKQPLLDLLGS